ncbi:Subtilisin-like protease 6 [Colletotrichum sp. SAR11_240]|nr:Subtilisin-like protease 6 [Colletotrichum sp. SAR11_240]
MRVLKLALMVVAMALVHSAAAKHNNHSGNKKGMQDLNDTQLEMEGPLDDNLWANGDESAVPIANEQQGEAVKFEA